MSFNVKYIDTIQNKRLLWLPRVMLPLLFLVMLFACSGDNISVSFNIDTPIDRSDALAGVTTMKILAIEQPGNRLISSTEVPLMNGSVSMNNSLSSSSSARTEYLIQGIAPGENNQPVIKVQGSSGHLNLHSLKGGKIPLLIAPVEDVFATTDFLKNQQSVLLNPRAGQITVTLKDGRVLIAGGFSLDESNKMTVHRDAYLYDPKTGVFSDDVYYEAPQTKSKSKGMFSPRAFASAVLLEKSNKVLITGGFYVKNDQLESLMTLEVFDPALNLFTSLYVMGNQRAFHKTVYDKNYGRAFIVGGISFRDGRPVYLDSIDIFNENNYQVIPNASGLKIGKRAFHDVAVLKANNLPTQLIISGGFNDTLKVLDTIKAIDISRDGPEMMVDPPKMSVPRFGHTSTAMSNGLLAIVGGFKAGTPGADPSKLAGANPTKKIDLYNPFLNQGNGGDFVKIGVPTLSVARAFHSAVMLGNDRIAILGGADHNKVPVGTIELLTVNSDNNLVINQWVKQTNPQIEPRYYLAATFMQTRMVLITGGFGAANANAPNAVTTAELFNPPANKKY